MSPRRSPRRPSCPSCHGSEPAGAMCEYTCVHACACAHVRMCKHALAHAHLCFAFLPIHRLQTRGMYARRCPCADVSVVAALPWPCSGFREKEWQTTRGVARRGQVAQLAFHHKWIMDPCSGSHRIVFRFSATRGHLARFYRWRHRSRLGRAGHDNERLPMCSAN